MTTLGILGGGQLARMLAQAAQRIGVNVAILDEDEFSPAMQVTSFGVTGSWRDRETLGEFADVVDAITIESEFVPVELIEFIERRGRRVLPGSRTLALVQDKFIQKQTLNAAGLPTTAYAAVGSLDEVKAFGARHGYPLVLKTRTLGYDGYGNVQIDRETEAQAAWDKLAATGRALMVEQFVRFKRELAIIVVRGQDGRIVTYPVTETLQLNHVCHVVRVNRSGFDHPAKDIGRAVVEAVHGVGAFGIEMFELPDGRVLVNEVAPRVHNSGHYTIEACLTSQFENHVRAVLGLPLGWPDMVKQAAVMVNCLGTSDQMPKPRDFERALSYRGAHLHWYGKRECRKGRKMGHITAVHDSQSEAERIARMAAGDLMSAPTWFL
ncbi:MAG: 5-(carboxyamino)imidazole ribonucleotide synthase [Anaerolineae bacterium]|nr:5-(carboxyamino)imidazole ribonucleotide synthase [Candidatus Roseilinea sp.]MDW8451692.1 5-(carboxyamino)imidazole ribonucleotide synthase [Anaerolineae bacterium]